MRRRQLPPHLALDPLLSENEVCSWVGFSLRTLQRKRKDGSIVGIPWIANRYRFRKSEIERFIAATEKETVVRFGGDQHESASSPGHFFGTGIETGVRDFIRPKRLRFAGLGG